MAWRLSRSTAGTGGYSFDIDVSADGYCPVKQGQAVHSPWRIICIVASTLACKRAEIIEISDTDRSEEHHA
jgi:hypothetical protein